MAVDKNRCDWATQIPDLLPDEPREKPVWGLVVHTSGQSIVEKAKKADASPIEFVLDYYQRAKYSCHYVVDYDGELYQITADDRRVQHVGLDAAERKTYFNGKWVEGLSSSAVKRWQKRFPGKACPASLYPSTYPNTDFVGVEMLPLVRPFDDMKFPTPSLDSWYSKAQHKTVGRLASDLSDRHAWGYAWCEQWSRGQSAFFGYMPRLVCHEDLSPLRRWDKGGGWDPGQLRATPRLDWGLILQAIHV